MKQKVQGKMVFPLTVILCLVIQYIVTILFGHSNTLYITFALIYGLLAWIFGVHYDYLKSISERDTLTGAYNRRTVQRRFQQLKKIANKKSKKIIVFFIDVDNFKMINDRYGHNIGDFILQKVSDILRQTFGQNDIIVRWGGDEFLVMSLCDNESGVEMLLNYLYQQLTETALHEISIKVTLSVGYAVYPDESSHLQEVLSAAGKKMYQQKQMPYREKRGAT